MAKKTSHIEPDKVATENAVRAAAISAARGAPISKSFLSKIVADTDDPSLTVADRVLRASSMAEKYVASPKALNTISATPQEIAAETAAMRFASSRIAAARSPLTDGGRGKASYQGLANTDARALQSLTASNFANSAFMASGLDFGMVSYLRTQDRSFTAQNVLNAANDVRALGFSVNDRAAMLDHTIIDRHDPKARVTNTALQNYQQRIESDNELCALHDKRKHATTPGERKALDTEIAAKRASHAKETGLEERIADRNTPVKAVAATKRRKTAIEKKAEQLYDRRPALASSDAPTSQVSTKANTTMFKKLNHGLPK